MIQSTPLPSLASYSPGLSTGTQSAGCGAENCNPPQLPGSSAICLTSVTALPPLGPLPRPRGSVALALTSGLPGSIHGHLDGSVVGGHLRGVGEHGDGQCETLPWGEWGIKKRLAPGTIHNTLKPSSSRRSRSLYFEPGQKIGFWVKFKLLGLAFKAPGGLAPTLSHSPAPRSGHPSLLPPASWPLFVLFLLSRDPCDFGVGSSDEYIFFFHENN